LLTGSFFSFIAWVLVKTIPSEESFCKSVTVSSRKNSEAKSSLSAIQIYLPFALSIPFIHCLKTLPEFFLL
jgi:hypothetical protein